ncbi:unnamed protein product [Litomosoides sigmodontis]|uniref:Negative elongation factor E n=1 Tax=Litomosoides sigmodontis TaxID=42156 RepID=A0A3P6SB16_LITSI|nr:unnamed protein product [Litomosoides sigmodontis]
MKSARDTGLLFPSTLSGDEKRLKEMFEKLRAVVGFHSYSLFAKLAVRYCSFDWGEIAINLQQAEEATEEVKRKVLIGAVSFKKADEKKDSFKRSSLIGKRRDSCKTKTDNNAVFDSNTELSPNADIDNNKPLFSDDHSEAKTVTGEPSDSSDLRKSSVNFDNGATAESNVSTTRKSGPGSTRASSTRISPQSDAFDSCKARDGSSALAKYEPINLGSSGDFDTSRPFSSFDGSKQTSVDGDDNYKPRSAQSISSNATSESSPFIGFEQSKPCKASNSGPCVYVRGYDLVADSLRNVFSKYGVINRIFVEERKKSAFITYATTEEAEAAIKEMDGNMVNGITLCVSFARRQNQYGDSGHFRGTKSFDRINVGNKKDYSNHSRGERCGRFKGIERLRFRGRKSGGRRSRGYTCESGESSLLAVSVETNDNLRSDANEASGVESAMQSSLYKDGFWSAGRQSPERMSRPSVEENDKEDDGFDTCKSTISRSQGDDLNAVNKKDGEFDTCKPFNNDGDSSNYEDNFGKRRGSFEHRGGEERSDRCRGFRGGGRSNRMPRRGSRNRRDSLWRSGRRSGELGDIDNCSTDDLDVGRKSAWLTGAKSGNKDYLGTSNESGCTESDVASPESQSLQKGKDGKDDFWRGSSRSSNGDDESSARRSAKKTTKEVGAVAATAATAAAAAATNDEEIAVIQRKPEARKQVSYDEDNPFA